MDKTITHRDLGKPPCYKCELRTVGCHSTCEAYIQWADNQRAAKQNLLKDAESITAYSVRKSIKIAKESRRKFKSGRNSNDIIRD